MADIFCDSEVQRQWSTSYHSWLSNFTLINHVIHLTTLWQVSSFLSTKATGPPNQASTRMCALAFLEISCSRFPTRQQDSKSLQEPHLNGFVHDLIDCGIIVVQILESLDPQLGVLGEIPCCKCWALVQKLVSEEGVQSNSEVETYCTPLILWRGNLANHRFTPGQQ